MNNKPKTLKAERVQFYFEKLLGWILLKEWNPETREDEPYGFWTVFEMEDHLDACEMVVTLGHLADDWGASPALDVRNNLVYVTCGSVYDGLTIEDCDFARAVDREIGTFQRQKSLLDW